MDVPRLSQRESGRAHWLPSLIGMKAEIVFLLLPALLLPFSSISEGGVQGESPLSPEPGCYLSSLLLDFSSVQFRRSVVSNSLRPHEPQHARPPCPSPTPRVYSNSCPLSGWCHPTISSSVVPFSSCPQSFPASGSFQMRQFFASVQCSSVQSLGRVWLFATPWIATHQASMSITSSRSLPKLMPIELVMPCNHLILSWPLLLLPSIFPSIRAFSNESTLHIRWPKYWRFSFNISSSNESSGMISFRMDWLDLLATSLLEGLSRVFSNNTIQKH